MLHVSPESADGGPLGLIRTGDLIRLDVPARRLDLLVDDLELETRQAVLPDHLQGPQRGYRRLYLDEVLQAEKKKIEQIIQRRKGVQARRRKKK